MADQVTLRITAEVTQALQQVSSLRAAYLNFAAQWTAATKQAATALNKFSGDDVKRQALNMAAAVKEIGGAARLTAKEMQQINIVVGEAINKYKALGQTAPAELHKLWLETKKIGEETKRSGDFFNRAFFRLTGAITAADLAAQTVVKSLGLMTDAVGAVTKAIIDLGAQGSKVLMISEGFTKLQNAMGQIGGRTLDAVRSATRGLISDFDLMRQANRAMLFGLEVTPEKFSILGEAAIKLGRAMGIDAPRAMDDLVLALGRVSPRILDNLGIIVKVGEANAKWAKEHNTTIQAMTAGQRVQAFYEESLKKIEEHVKNLGDFSLTLADRVQILTVKFENFRNELGLAINLSPVLREAFKFISEEIEKVFGVDRETSIKTIIRLIEDLSITLVRLGKHFLDAAEFGFQASVEILKGWNEVAFVLSKIVQLYGEYRLAVFKLREATTFGGEKKVSQDLRIEAELFLRDQRILVAENRKALDSSLALARGEGQVAEAFKNARKFLEDLEKRMVSARGTMADYSSVQDKLTNGTHTYRSAEEDLDQALENSSKERELLAKNTRALAAALEMAERHGTPATVVLKEYGAKITDIVNRSQVFGMTVPESINRWADALEKSQPARDKFVKTLTDLNRVLSVIPKDMPFEEVLREFGPAIQDANDRAHAFSMKVPEYIASWVDAIRAYKETMKKIEEGNEKLNADIERWDAHQKKLLSMKVEFDKKFLKLQENGREDRLEALRIEYDQAMAELGPMITGFETEWMEAASAIGKAHIAATEKVKSTWGSTITELTKTLPKALLQAFSGGGNVMNTVSAAIGNIIGPKLFNAEGGIGKKLSDMLLGTKDSAGLAGKGGIFGALAKGVGELIPLIGPLIGSLAGPIMKGIKRLFTGPSMEKKVAADLGRDFGQEFSKALVDKITADANRTGDRMAAISLHLADVIEEAGGVTTSNVNKWIGKTRDLFVFLERGIITSEEAAKSLNEVIPNLAATFKKAGGIWNAQFRELIDLTKREGLEIQAITDLLEEQVVKLSGGTSKVISGFTAPLLREIDKINAELETTTGKTEAQIAELTTKASEKFKNMGQGAQEEFERINRIALRAFNTMVAEGKSPIEAIDAIGPSIEELIKVADQLGLKGNAAFESLKRWQTLVSGNRELLDQAQGLNDILVASINLRTLDEEGFKDLQDQGLETYAKLQEAGFTEQESLLQMKGFLESVIKAHEERGLAIDEETAKLIAQAREQGVLAEEQISTNDILKEGLGEIIVLLGGELPEAWRKVGKAADQAAEDSANALEEALKRVEDVNGELKESKERWEDFGEAAEEAGKQAEEAVDGVSYGHSPGGLKEWEPLFSKSRRAMKAFTQEAIRDMGQVTRLMADASSVKPSRAHTGAVLSRFDSLSRTSERDGRIVWTGDMNVSTWTLGQEQELIRKKITPGVLRTVNDGGDAGKSFDSMVRRTRK